MSKILTIVIPTYNMERYLERCLSSLITSQELMSLFEVLVINDGSKDRSSEIAHSYQEKYPETFRVIDKENGNYGSCINRGLKEAEGKYIKTLDADDWFDTKNFEEFLKALTLLDVDCVISDMQKVDDHGNLIEEVRYSLPTKHEFSLSYMIKHCICEFLWMHCVAYRTENLRAIHYHQSEGMSYTDQEWLYLPMTTCKSICYLPKVVYKYLVGRDGQTMDPAVFKKSFRQEIKGTMIMATELSHQKNTDNDVFEYLKRRVFARCNKDYGMFFLEFQMDTCYDEMVELDGLLHTHALSVYEELEKLYRFEPFRYHFVKKWREKGYPRKLWLLRTGLFLGSLFSSAEKHK